MAVNVLTFPKLPAVMLVGVAQKDDKRFFSIFSEPKKLAFALACSHGFP